MIARYLRIADEYREDLEGHLTGHGSPHGLGDLPVDRLCSFIWWYYTHGLEEVDRLSFKARLWRPEKVDELIPAKSPWSAESEMAAFASLKAETEA